MKKVFLLICFFALQGFSSTKFLVVGDTHHYSPSANFKQSILYEITIAAIQEKVAFVFFVGDLVLYDCGQDCDTDSLLQDWKFILDTLDMHGIRVFACRGNNDISSSESWNTLFSGRYALPADGPETERLYTYSVAFEDFLLISLDQYTEYNRINQGWLDKELESNSRHFVFVASHEPAFKVFHAGLSTFPDERDAFWKSLSDHHCNIYFCGHDHFYDHSIILGDGDSARGAAHQIIVGTGGGWLHSDTSYDGDNGSWQQVAVYHEESFGYLVVEIDEGHLSTTWKHRVAAFEFEEGGDSYDYPVTAVGNSGLATKRFRLAQNYPNPFNPTTVIQFEVPGAAFVSLVVYDVVGRKVRTLVNEVRQFGRHAVTLNTSGMSGGVYFCRLVASGVRVRSESERGSEPPEQMSFFKTIKMVVLK